MNPSEISIWTRDFLLFREFIAPSVLFLSYYLGALMIPVLAYDLGRRLHRRWLQGGWQADLQGDWRESERQSRQMLLWLRARVVLFALIAFFLMQIGWRMFFEMMLAYFQMHAALTGMPAM